MKRRRPVKKTIIGVTGVFGSGKSTVSRIFRSFGADIIDADRIAHRYLLPGAKAYKAIVNSFGRGVLKARRKIDRRKLARLVFSDRKSLNKLNSIIHPGVITQIKSGIKKAKKGIVVLDAPLLLEAGLKGLVDELVVVVVDRESLIRRLVKKTSLKKEDILKRIRSQIPLRKKKRAADFIIDNSGTIKKTSEQVKKVINEIQGGSCGEIRD